MNIDAEYSAILHEAEQWTEEKQPYAEDGATSR